MVNSALATPILTNRPTLCLKNDIDVPHYIGGIEHKTITAVMYEHQILGHLGLIVDVICTQGTKDL